ncbi:MAG: inositol monophosphatase family protein [Promethearchaeota archaeon]
MSPLLSFERQRFWSRNLRNAAGLARLRVLECLRKGSCRDAVGTGAGGDTTKEFDSVAEQTMISYLERLTSFTVISEETGTTQCGPNPEGFLIMDPIDGSTNVSHDISFACIAIAYGPELIFDALECAVVLDLFSGICYHAVKGQGAFRESERIYPAEPTPLDTSLVGVDSRFPPVSLSIPSKGTDKQRVRFIRHFGANALELCYVADGSLDGFIDLRGVFRGTDLAAPSLILNEAGAALLDQKGLPVKGQCTNETHYSYLAARDESFAKNLLALASGKEE